MNNVQLCGHLGKDPETRSLQNGTKVTNLSIATTERWKDKESGEKKERTEWHRVVAFGPLAGIIETYCKKGSQVLIQGKLRTRKWDKNGEAQYTTEVVLDGPQAQLHLLSKAEKKDEIDSGYGSDKGDGGLDDDIPF